MFLIKLKRVSRAAWINFWRNGVVSATSVFVFVVTLSVIGSLIFAQVSLDAALAQIKDKVDITVYLKHGTPEESVLALKKSVDALPEVKSSSYLSAGQALALFRDRHKDNAVITSSLNELGDNPLGASIEIKARDPSQYESIAAFLNTQDTLLQNSIIEKVNYAQNKAVINRLTAISRAVERIGFMIAFVFIVLAVLVTFNTIQLAIYTAREEITVMRLVGASNNYVKGPFVIEGIIYGAIAGILALLLFFPATAWVGNAAQSFLGGVNIADYYRANFWELFVVIEGSGVILGAISSYFAVLRYLRV